MLGKKQLIITLLLITLLIGVTQAPAILLAPLLHRYFPMLEFNSLQGTVWKGVATEAQLTITDRKLPLNTVHWSLQISSLFSLTPIVDIETQADEQQFKGVLTINSPSEFRLDQTTGHFPSHLLEPWLALWVSGDLQVIIHTFNYVNNRLVEFSATLSALDTQWLLADTTMHLGNYTAVAHLNNNIIVIDIDDQQAALGINGRMLIQADGGYHFGATLMPRDHLAIEIKRTLEWLGRADRPGGIRIEFNGKLN